MSQSNRPKTTIHVTNITKDKAALKSLFQNMDGFRRISFHQDYCFVCFDNLHYATDAIDHVHGRTDMLAAYAKHGVACANTPTIAVMPNPILYVSLFSYFTEVELTRIFKSYEGFDSCRFFPNHALVRFKDVGSAKHALEDLNSTTNLFANYSTKGAKQTGGKSSRRGTGSAAAAGGSGQGNGGGGPGSHSGSNGDDDRQAIDANNSSENIGFAQANNPKRTIHVTNIEKDKASVLQLFSKYEGFRRVAFYADYCFVCFTDTRAAAKAIEEILFKTKMKANFAKADFIPHLIPPSAIGQPNHIIRVSDYPSSTSDHELVRFFEQYDGFTDIQFYHASCLVYYKDQAGARRALEAINGTTNFTAIYSKKGVQARGKTAGANGVLKSARNGLPASSSSSQIVTGSIRVAEARHAPASVSLTGKSQAPQPRKQTPLATDEDGGYAVPPRLSPASELDAEESEEDDDEVPEQAAASPVVAAAAEAADVNKLMLARGQGGEDVVPSSDPLDNESVDKETFVDPDSGHDAHQPLDSQVPQDLDFASLRQQHDMALMAQDPLFSSRSVTGANTNHLVLGRHPMSNGPALDISRDSLDSAAMLGAENIKLESIDTPIPAPDKRSNNASVPFGSTTSIADSTALPFPSPIRLDLAPRPYAPQHAYMPDFPPGPAPHHHMIIDTRQHHMVVLEKNEIEKQLMAAKGCIDDLFQEYVRLERENRFLRDGAGYTSSQEQQQAYLGNGSQRLLPRRIPHHHVPHDGINNSIPFPRSSTSGEPAQDPLSSRVEFHQQRLLVPQHQQLQPQQQQQQQQQQQSSEFDNTALHSFGTHGFDSNAETVSLKALAMHAADTAKSAGRGSPPQEDTIAGSLRASIATLSAPAGGNGIHGIPASTPMDSHASQWRYHPQMYAITNAVSIGTSSSSATTATTTLPPATTTTEDSSLPPSTAPQQQEQQDIYTENERLKRELAHVRELLKRRNVEYMRLDAVHKSCGVLQGLLAMCE